MDKSLFLAWAEAPLPYEIPNFGTVYLRQWTALEREDMASWQDKNKGKLAEFASRVLLATMVSQDGTPMFTKEDIPQLCKLPAKGLDLLFEACITHNKVDKKSVEDLEKN